VPGGPDLGPSDGGTASAPPAPPARRADRLAQIRGLVAAGGPEMTLRPIRDLRDMRLLAVEARPRFPGDLSPESWFADAQALGVALELDLAAVAAALAAVRQALPEGTGLWLPILPATAAAPQLAELLAGTTVPVTVEISERALLGQDPGLTAALDTLRRSGVELAVEGVAAGYPGLRHILRLQPDAVKVDGSLIRDIHRDLARTELTRAVARVTSHFGAFLVADGIVAQEQLDALVALGITAGQGPGLPDGVPAPAPSPGGPPAGAARAGSGVPQQLGELARPVLELVIRLTGLETAYLTVLDPDLEWMEHRYVCNTGTLEVPEGLTIAWIDSLCKRCRDAGLLWTPDVPHDLPPIPLGEDAPIQTFVSVPVVLADGRTAGTLCGMSSAVRHLDEDMLAELTFFARLLAERYAHEFVRPAATPLTHGQQLAGGDTGGPTA
jgi:EAL domain-containing protein (putative c-di-GMP-specific phosphodiesterase class I)